MLVWDELKTHIHPSEIDNYSRRIGLARISRNEEIYSELSLLRQLHSNIEDNLTNEIQKKNPGILSSAQRSAAISRAVQFLDSLRSQGHFVDPTDQDDSNVLKYLKFTRMQRPATGERPSTVRELRQSKSARSIENIEESISEVQEIIDDEYAALQIEAQELRAAMFASCETLQEVKEIRPPSTQTIEGFNKRLQTQEVVLRNIAKAQGSATTRLRDSVRLNRLWD
jgi:hypothetical protein